MGISRGFTKAGCKSIISTLWSVADKSSSNLMALFYNQLSKGNGKAHSLSQAKRMYLQSNTGIYTHPFFWSGYVLTGNDTPIFKKRIPTPYYAITIAGLILICSIWLFWNQTTKN